MEKELGTANEMATADLSGGFYNLKEAVYNFLGNFFSWLSTHQGLVLIFMIGVLGIMIWVILRVRKHGKQLEGEVSSKKTEIGEKDALIEEQKTKLEVLQKKLSDQQRVVSEALLSTIKTLTGYDEDQLQIFFKFLTEISGNPLQWADTQANTMPKSQLLEEESDDSTEENDAKEKIAAGTGSEEVIEVKKK
ncbi:MAG: hypothetical protein DRH90_20055 [Deltaproteobacteria bacterium]|nr:MAG: hypothetical protein DRH90_20055 [Deltaproteobacteria bacterium]